MKLGLYVTGTFVGNDGILVTPTSISRSPSESDSYGVLIVGVGVTEICLLWM